MATHTAAALMTSSAASASSSLPLAGVRVFLCIRNDTPATPKAPHRRAARHVLKAVRAQVHQLGATLALSEGGADVVVFHHGSPSLLHALHAKFKAVVRPDYLAACLAANRRLEVAPYVVGAEPSAEAGGECTASVALSTATPGRLSSRAARTPPSRRAASSSSRSGSARVTAATPSGTTACPVTRSSAQVESTNNNTKTIPSLEAAARNTATRRFHLLDDDEEVEAKGEEKADEGSGEAVAERAASPSSTQALSSTRVDGAPQKSPTVPALLNHAQDSSARQPLPHAPVSLENSDADTTPPLATSRDTAGAASLGSLAGSSKNREDGPRRALSPPAPLFIAHSPADTSASATPKLTPSHRLDARSSSPQLSQDTSAAAATRWGVVASPRRGEAEDEEEFIRHAVLRSTATTAVTRRRGRLRRTVAANPLHAPSLEECGSESAYGSFGGKLSVRERNSAESRKRRRSCGAVDPFLATAANSANTAVGSLPPSSAALSLSASWSELSLVPVTQPLSESTRTEAVVAPASLPSKKTTPTAATPIMEGGAPQQKRRSVMRTVKDVSKTGLNGTRKTAPSSSPPPQQQQQQPVHSRVRVEPQRGAAKRRRRPPSTTARADGRNDGSGGNIHGGDADVGCALAELPVSMTFSNPTLLARLPPDEAADVCVHFFLDEESSRESMEGQPQQSSSVTAAASLSFLCDVVEQLGGVSVSTGDDSWFGPSTKLSSSNKKGGCRSISSSIHAVGRTATRKVTHLVVSHRAVLTPDILYFKALGIPIVTPQWVYDAIALGGFAAVVPHLHAHPVFGDVRSPEHVGQHRGRANATLTAATTPHCGRHPVDNDDEEDTGGLLGTKETVYARTEPGQQKPPPQSALSSTLQLLHKEVADEYVPAGEQAKRPYYAPFFQDCMFFLYVPPTDLLQAQDGGSGKSSSSGHHRQWCSAKRRGKPRAHSTTYLGDVTAALQQATQLIRLLGGTVTRNLASTYLDLVIDLTGLYERTIEAGQQQQQQQQRALRESLSCAYYEALSRLSQLPDECAVPSRAGLLGFQKEKDAAVDSSVAARQGPPPVVGISWLLHSILQRQQTEVAPFVLAGHPLAPQLAALHGEGPLQSTGSSSCCSCTVTAIQSGTADPRGPVTETHAAAATSNRVPTPTFTDSSASLSSSATASSTTPSAERTSTSQTPPTAGCAVTAAITRDAQEEEEEEAVGGASSSSPPASISGCGDLWPLAEDGWQIKRRGGLHGADTKVEVEEVS